MYAIVDVETTGGKFNEEGITEIAIYRFDGHEIVDQFASLVNPEKPIQPFVVKLTGINNAMLERAPKFYEVAKRIIEITNDAVIVAHNASFDQRMLRLEFDRLGFTYDKQTLCTVELAQDLLPDQESYNLGKLTKSLGIPLTDRHRATGDALATVKLFKLLLQKDLKKEIISKSLKSYKPIKVAPNLKDILDKTPSTTGVYYVYNDTDTIIQIGKSKNLKKKLTQLFTSSNKKAKHIQKHVADVVYEKTGSELIASIKEYVEIKKHRPQWNGRPKKRNHSHGLYLKESNKGYASFYIKSIQKDPEYLISFSSLKSGKAFLERIYQEYDIHDELLEDENLDGSDQSISMEPNEDKRIEHSDKMQQIIDQFSLKNKSKIIVDRGREASERSVILIENGTVAGYAYNDLRIQISDPEILKRILVPVEDNGDLRHIVQSYLRSKKVYQIYDV